MNTCVLTIAGSDSGAAAGVQADLKTFAAVGVHGLTAITALTAQNTRRIVSVNPVPARVLADQIEAVLAEYRIGAVKIGMLGTAANAATVATLLHRQRLGPVVLDPVLASTSGTPLLSARGLHTLRQRLIPLADVLTPNRPEAEILLGRRIGDRDVAQAAQDLRALGVRAVLLKGGHARGREVRDVLATQDGVREFAHARLPIRARGTGCVLSSAIAAYLARGRSLIRAIADAERFLQRALRASYRPGKGVTRILQPFARS